MVKRTLVGLVGLVAAFLASLPCSAFADGLRINEFMAVNQTSHTNAFGDYSDWVEIYNSSATATNLAGWYLTDKADNLTKWRFPSVNIAAGGYVMVYADSAYDVPYTNGQVYASMGLSGSGEYLALVRSNGVTVADEFSPVFPPQNPDISYGIGTSGEKRFFVVPTPGITNSAGFDRVATPQFSHMRGFYTNGFSLTLTCETASASIRYTLDGSTPSDTAGTLYTGTPITIDSLKCVRAVAYKSGDFLDSDVMTHSYLFLDDVMSQSPFNAAPGPSWPSSNVNGQAIDYEMDPFFCGDPASSNTVKNSLLAIPTVSLVTDLENLFDPTWGIYVNPQSEAGENVDPYPYNDSWERPTSVELIYPDGTPGFQEDAGLRIRGGASRSPTNPKHSFRLRFRSEYGASALKFKLFGVDGADRHNGVELRCASGGAFMKPTDVSYAYIRDLFSMDLQLACGHPSTRGDKCHLYVNGVYWGLYETQEKIEQASMAEYAGGEPEDYDMVIKKKHGSYVDGSQDAYSNLWAITIDGYAGEPGLTNYFRAQGLEADGVTRNPAYPRLLDVRNLADYALHLYWTGDRDSCHGDWGLNNYVCGINRVNPDGFKFYEYDNEGTLDGGRADLAFHMGPVSYGGSLAAFTAQDLHQELTACDEYLIAFADLTYERMFNEGVFTDDRALALFMRRADETDQAMYAEAARWGDFLGEPPKSRDNEWLSAIVSCTNWMKGRAQAVVDQLRVVGWYPAIDPPVFYIDGVTQRWGMVTNGAALTMTGSHPIYYTLDGTDPRALGGSIAGVLYQGAISLTNAAVVKARTYDDSGLTNIWSALNEVVYAFEKQAPVSITELMYNPRGTGTVSVAGAQSRSDFEFIEICNVGTNAVGLADLVFNSGIEFDFKDSSVLYLGAGERLVLANNYMAFTNRYGTNGIAIAGEYRGSLNDGGERIRIIDGLGRTNVNFIYDDTRLWPLAADGAGHSLVPLVTDDQSNRILDYPGNWRASAVIDGSPGVADPVPGPGVVINEIVAHTDFNDVSYPDYDSNDWLELFNTGPSNIPLANWYLSDDLDDLAKWAIHTEIVMGSGTRRVLDEVHDFHSPITNGFGINKIGESIYLSYLPGIPGQDRVVDAISFKGQENGVAWGQYPDGDSWFRTLPATRSAPNEAPGMGVLITEIMYNPLTNAVYPTNNVNDEFVEVFNGAATNVNLYNNVGNWHLDGLGYTFPSNEVIGSGEAILVVTFDPATNPAALSAFTNAYGVDPAVRVFGPCEGLDNRMEKIGLERPQAPDGPEDPVSWVVLDEVTYFDQAPWDTGADGTGDSLHRWPQSAIVSGAGNDPGSWIVASPSPGTPRRDIVLTSPSGGTSVFEPFTISVSALTYASGIIQVEFFANGSSIGVDTTPPYDVNWGTGVGDGTYSLEAVVTTGEGVSTSIAEQVVVYGNPADDSWTKRVKVDFPGYNRAEVLTNFPVLVKISEVIPGFLYNDLASPSDAADLRFGDGSESVALPYEIEKWDISGDSYVWVRVPALTNGASIYVYYGDAGNGAPGYRTDGTVWSEDFEGVWHMDPTLSDATTAHGGADMGTTNAPYGPGGDCRGFDGTDDVVVPGISRTWYGDNVKSMTISVWARPTSGVGDMTLFGARNEGSPVSPPDGRKLHIKQTAGGMWEYAVGFFPNSASHSVDAGEWQMLTLTTYTNGIQVYYVGYKNGEPMAAPQGWVGSKNFDYDPVIGHMSGEMSPGYYFDGLVDECRVSGVNRSANWIWAVWTNMVPGSEFVSYGTVEDAAPAGPVDNDDDGMADNWEGVYFSATNAVNGGPNEDWDGDGYRNMWEYIAGTDPTDNTSHFALSILLSNGQWVVCFPTIEATGTGYVGVDRLYDLESRTNLLLGDWVPIQFYTNLLGDGGEVVHTNVAPQRIYYRSRTHLE